MRSHSQREGLIRFGDCGEHGVGASPPAVVHGGAAGVVDEEGLDVRVGAGVLAQLVLPVQAAQGWGDGGMGGWGDGSQAHSHRQARR